MAVLPITGAGEPSLARKSASDAALLDRTKRAELAGQIDALQDQRRETMIQVAIARSACSPPTFTWTRSSPSRCRRVTTPFKGQVTPAILAMLGSDGAMDAKAITIRLVAERELNVKDKTLAKATQKRIGATLRNLRERQLVTSAQSGAMLLWTVAKA